MGNRSPSSRLRMYAVICSFFVVAFLCFWVRGFANQVRTLWFQSVPGQIDSISKSVTHSMDSVDSYSVEVTYHYTVNGAVYHSKLLRMPGSTYGNGSNQADAWLDRLSRKGPTIVYYNPGNPAEAVLVQGLDVVDFIALVFFLSIVLIAVLLWHLAARAGDGANSGRRWKLTAPLATAAGILGGGSLIMVILVGFTPAGRAVMAATPAILSVLVVAAVVAGGILMWRGAGAERDLVVDRK